MTIKASRRTLLFGAPSILAGCAPGATPLPLDRQALAGIRRIAVAPVGAPPQPVVQVVDAYSQRLGILGRIASSSAGDTRSATLADLLAAQGLDPAAVLQAALNQSLGAHGFGLAARAPDATLAATITEYGFVASGGGSDQPFRSTVTLAVELASSATTLFRDMVGPTGGAPGFPSFVAIENDPSAAAASLRQALAAAAAAVVQRFS